MTFGSLEVVTCQRFVKNRINIQFPSQLFFFQTLIHQIILFHYNSLDLAYYISIILPELTNVQINKHQVLACSCFLSSHC